jgi:polysaccharide biosynthesis/export protein
MQLLLILMSNKSTGSNSKNNRVWPISINRNFLLLFIAATLGIHLISCTGPNKMAYMRDITDTAAGSLSRAVNIFESPIQKNDQLWITIGGTNMEDLLLLNSGSGIVQGSNISPTVAGSNAPVMGYLVERDGNIKLPYLDKVKAEGLSRMELENYITEKMKDYTKNPVVNVRFLNYRITVIGAVKVPGNFSIPTERVTVLEALGLAGDLTVFGKRDNVLVIREVNGERTFGRMNLGSKALFNSPYYYLKTNDIVYVEPSKASSINRERVPQYVGMAAGVLSLITTIIVVTK